MAVDRGADAPAIEAGLDRRRPLRDLVRSLRGGRAAAVSAPQRAVARLSAVGAGTARSPGRDVRSRRSRLILLGILAVGALLRVWQINAVGLNSDEAVYSGQGASIAGTPELEPYFPMFRAHPLVFQTLVSFGYQLHLSPVFGRFVAAALGVVTIWLVYATGKLLYGRRAGLIAAAIVALMPYHVIVTRQILLDGPMVLWTTATLYMVARWALTERLRWLLAAAATFALTVLTKETSVILFGAMFAFVALTPALRVTLWQLVVGGALFVVLVSAYPLSLSLAGATRTGGNFVAWQLFRRPNHEWTFYPATVPVAIGLLVCLAAAGGLYLLRRDRSWRETLLLSWIAVPAAFFELFPVKGFQYLLPAAPAVALLAGRALAHWDVREFPGPGSLVARYVRLDLLKPAVVAVVLLSLAIPSWRKIQPSTASTFLAGSGGLPGGRETGRWIDRHIPRGAKLMTVGPSMANVLQFYGHRKMYGLSVSTNPLHRNPVYEPLKNPDRLIRDNELQYVVWDAFSAGRAPFFARRLLRYVERYNGNVAYSQTVRVKGASGRWVRRPVITIYAVRP